MAATRLSTYDALIEAAFEVLSKTPKAPLSRIAERAGVGRATLHRHFKGRDDLILELARRGLSEMDEAVDCATKDAKSYGGALHATLAALIPLGNRHGFLAHEPIDDDIELARHMERQNQEMRDAVKRAQNEGAFDESAPVSWIVRSFESLLYAAWESVRADELTVEQATELAWGTLTSGMGGKK